ncbi:MAG: hypothetical protein ACJA2X_001980 [Halocynthiibacter sp.]
MKVIFFVAMAALLPFSNAANAGPKTKVSVLWQDFPKGTNCAAEGIQGALKVGKKRGHPKVDVVGYGEIGTFFCILPDGRKIVTDINTRLPIGTKVAGITVYPDGRTFLTASSSAGLVSQQFANTLSVVK